MKNLLRLLHLGGSQEDPADSSKSMSSSFTKHRLSFSEPASGGASGDSKALTGLSNWLTAAKNTLNPPSSSNQNAGTSRITGGSPKGKKEEGTAITTKAEDDIESACKRQASASATMDSEQENMASIADAGTQAAMLRLVDTQALSLADVEEYQVQVAMALSVSDDPEATAIETAKQISLGSDPTLSNTPAEVLAFRYWKYNCLNYDDKVMDGFYDVYGVVSDASSETMPAFVDLQETPVSDQMTWEVVLVNRATDPELVKIEQKALAAAASCEAVTVGLQQSTLIQRIADIVVDHMGGRVVDTDLLLKRWRINSTELRSSLGNVVLPLGCLQVGLARHRALLFKVLADAVGIPCQLVKGKQYSGSDEGSVNIIKIDGTREFIIDLMGAPGTLLPSDVSGPVTVSNGSMVGNKMSTSMTGSWMSQLSKNTFMDERKLGSGVGLTSENDELGKKQLQEVKSVERYQSEPKELKGVENLPVRPAVGRHGHPGLHFRSPSWTEGLGSAGVNMKAKDASQYMIVTAKENPEFAQKLHDVLLESGVHAPANLFTEVSPKELQAQISDDVKFLKEKQKRIVAKGTAVRRKERSSVGPGRPHSPSLSESSSLEEGGKDRLQRLNSVEGLGERRPLEAAYLNPSPNSSPGSTASSGAGAIQSSIAVAPVAAVVSLVQDNLAPEIIKHVPVAAAAAATAAVVASSMVVAAAKSDLPEPTLEVPVAAAATATAAVVVATTAVAGRRLELYDSFPDAVNEEDTEKASHDGSVERQDEADVHVKSPVDISHEGQNSGSGNKIAEDERVSDKSTGSMSARSDPVLDDVSEWEILWEDLVIGERIGLGSYGEVYRGDWHGTEVAVKKFLDQDISGDALEEFRSEVRLMKRMRHPNVVLFMGAVMRPPNLSIVTEFLPRGSLYRLIHRPNNQLDERRRMRMALDVAKGMNYLHNSTPVIVHRDLKSPNLLVDKNWVVKVCDFGLSRMKHNTFLSSKSTAGTPEWMAPEVLRNEPSNEKSDVYSFGVILWELATLQQPWASMNPMQVVGAVGFQHRCLDIPETLDPAVARIIRQCWQSDPNARPSFAEIMAALKPLQKPITASQSVQSPKT